MWNSRRGGNRRVAALGVALAAVLALVALPTAPAGAYTVSAGVNRNVIRLGMSATVSGNTSTMAAGTTARVQRRINATTWSTRATGTVRGDGSFSVPITPTAVGIYALRVVTAVGTSNTFYLRILGPLRVDPGGLQTLRLGMTVNEAKATHWVTGVTSGCPLSGGKAAVFPPGIRASGEFVGGRLAWVAVNYGGSSVEGLKVGGSQASIASVYPSPTWAVSLDPDSQATYGVRLFTVRRSGTPKYGVTVTPANGKVSQIAVPYTPICD